MDRVCKLVLFRVPSGPRHLITLYGYTGGGRRFCRGLVKLTLCVTLFGWRSTSLGFELITPFLVPSLC